MRAKRYQPNRIRREVMDVLLSQSMMEELAEGHLELDRFGAPREIHEGGDIRECLIAERIRYAKQGG